MTRDDGTADDASGRSEFTRFFERYYDTVYRYAWRRMGPDHADDVAAETFGLVWARFDKVPRNEPLPWLYGVARNVVLARFRQMRRRGEVFSAFEGQWSTALTEADSADLVLDRQNALSVLNRLKPDDRELVMLLAWEGLDVPAAARALGCTVTTTRVRLHRARKRIERLLAAPAPTHRPKTTLLVPVEEKR